MLKINTLPLTTSPVVAESLEGEREALILLIKNAMTGYVMSKEGRNHYQGNGQYDSDYIQHSVYIETHRKRDIVNVNNILIESEGKKLSPVAMANALFTYLNRIKTGVNFLWLFQIGSNSELRNHIFSAIKSFNPIIYWLCFIDRVEEYASYQAKKPSAAKIHIANEVKQQIQNDSVISAQYNLLLLELNRCKNQLVNLNKQYEELEDKNLAKEVIVNQQKQRIYELELESKNDQRDEKTIPIPQVKLKTETFHKDKSLFSNSMP